MPGRRATWTATAVLALVVAGAAEGASAPVPTLSAASVALKRHVPAGGFAGTADVVVRICASIGPRAQLVTRESRVVGSVTKARAVSIDPLGVDLTHVYPYSCTARYEVGWAVPARLLVGGGTYSLSIRVRDGYGRLSAPVSFSWKPGPAS